MKVGSFLKVFLFVSSFKLHPFPSRILQNRPFVSAFAPIKLGNHPVVKQLHLDLESLPIRLESRDFIKRDSMFCATFSIIIITGK